MIERVISGGQTGADQAGWRAAKAAGIPTGGWMVWDFLTEDGKRPDFAAEFGARLLPEAGALSSIRAKLRRRAKANVRDSDGTIVFDATLSQASSNAYHDAEELGKPFRCVMLDIQEGDRCRWVALGLASHRPHDIAEWIREEGIKVLNVAGNRESKAPGIGKLVERYLTEVFRLLKESQ